MTLATDPPALVLTEADAAAVFDLFVRCRDDFVRQDGVEATPNDAVGLFSDVPEGKSASDQTILGWRDSHELDAIAAILRDYPARHGWYLGLLLVDPSRRGLGTGRLLHDAVARWALASGARELRLSVLEENIAATGFWQALGYRERRRLDSDTFKLRRHRRIEMTRAP
jgi:GNAT superfamily N-acetyltransferase